MSLTFSKFFESYTNYHSFVDLLNLCKEVSDYVYNEDIINNQFFRIFKETKDGYEIIFDKDGQKNYFINSQKKTIKDESGEDQLIDSVYEDIETLYSILRNDEMLINIKQIDENMKKFEDIIEYLDYDKIIEDLEQNGWNSNLSDFEKFEKSDYLKRPSNENEYIQQMNNWLNENKSLKSFNTLFPINEGFEDELKGKLSETYISLKRGILELLDKTLNGDVTKVQNFIDNFIDPDSEEILEGFVEDADIFDEYLKHQSDIDQILLDRNYYNDAPDVESLYDYVIDGTFDAVVYCMEDMKKDLFGE